MDLMSNLSKNEIREVFSKNWMTHDAMWYGACVQELGQATANQLNKAAVRSMAGVEILRVVKLMERDPAPPDDFQELAEIIETTFGLVHAKFMNFDFTFPEKNLLRGRFHECFAHKGLSRYGMIEGYDCGIVVRIQGWLEALGVSYVMEPLFEGCLMHQCGECDISFRFDLD